MAKNVRLQATIALHQVLTHERSLGTVTAHYQKGLSVQDQALFQELCFGVCRYLHRIQFFTKTLLKQPFKTKDHDILALLYLGIYQLLYTRIPDHAAIGETVSIAQKLKKPWAKGLLNGVLRNIQRDGESITAANHDNPVYQYSHPKWFIELCQMAWPSEWQSLLEANNQHPPFTLRLKIPENRAQYISQLNDQQIQSSAGSYSRSAITLEKPIGVEKLPGFWDGLVSVQDEAAQLAADLLLLEPGMSVLDACCAPGGKTCHILESQPNVSLLALDHDEQRLKKVQENLQRLKLQAILKEGDATKPQEWWDGKAFDRILLDAPCSATGVIRRHPDIKLLRKKQDIAQLATLQLSMLQALWATLKPGGYLVYATCSVLPQENEQVIASFLAQQKDAEHSDIVADWGLERTQGRQLFPQQQGHDGFYYARLLKQN